jgi:hypothetical protein
MDGAVMSADIFYLLFFIIANLAMSNTADVPGGKPIAA